MSYVSFDPRAAAARAARAQHDAEFSATLDSSSAAIADSARLVVLSVRVYAREFGGAAFVGTSLSILGMWQGWW